MKQDFNEVFKVRKISILKSPNVKILYRTKKGLFVKMARGKEMLQTLTDRLNQKYQR